MYTFHDKLGIIIKQTRIDKGFTLKELAKDIGISTRYLMSIENDNKKPSFSILFSTIRILSIKPDSIFYPEKPCKDNEIEDIVHMLYNCDKHSIKVIRATIKALLDR